MIPTGVLLVLITFSVLVIGGLAYFVLGGQKKPQSNRRQENEDLGLLLNQQDVDNNNDNNERRGGLSRARQRRREVAEQGELEGEANEGAFEAQFSDVGPSKKVGKKKLEKLAKKEEIRKAREQYLEYKEQQKKIEEEREEERMRDKEEEDLERQEEEEEKKEKEREEREKEDQIRKAKEQEEEEEYKKWKAGIEIESSGTGEEEASNQQSRLGEFIETLKTKKVVQLEDLASEFDMRTSEVINRIQTLDKNGLISGVIDDRGKFIYITREEMQMVAKYITRRGRVSIDEITRECNKLINLEMPTISIADLPPLEVS
eukprot:TRINITY_DN792_c0_g3_i1.p1 TRINITY_DN792_c0_g3~~TRINITY_DN792_c0_g3_i1.p1  ORF type:complete len:317 (-),score=100.61 TRINITY_DN792_c0_g3_i1:122-1072(-)